MPLTLVHEARTRDVLVKRRTTVRQMLIVFTPACYQHSGACAIVRGSEVDPRLAIDELLKDCPGAPLVITLQQLPGW